MSQVPLFADRAPVAPADVCIESMAVNALDKRRVDVAVDLIPCQKPVTIEMVIVGPNDEELSSILLIDNREWMLDKVMHLRQDAQKGLYTLHVGVFFENELVARAARDFTFPLVGAE